MPDSIADSVLNTPQRGAGLWRQWRDDIACVFERDPAARTVPEVIATYPGVHAVLIHRLSHRLWTRGWRFTARWLSAIGRFLSNVDIHPGAQLGARLFIDHGACVVIGETAVVGDNVTLYHGVTLGGTSWNRGKRHPTLEDGVLVGAGAKILGNITVRRNARVGANSVVVAEVPESCTVVGIPGKVVKVRSAGNLNPYGVDLDHHLIPDPVSKVVTCLMDRIDALERQVQVMRAVPATELFCVPDNELCEHDCAVGIAANQ